MSKLTTQDIDNRAPSKVDVLDYVRGHCETMARMARNVNRDFLAYLLQMAAIEAAHPSGGPRFVSLFPIERSDLTGGVGHD